ncbi:hypothetical protein GCM10009627_22800 [Curtobacterium herbarum]|uniref:Uncharacterized protein n=1 Tax=Curtobacterium herbarum TaxID=150122 RepID=A0ABN1ZF83_9MICO|nr:hypothetical protein [Curtobacterium herbarum]
MRSVARAGTRAGTRAGAGPGPAAAYGVTVRDVAEARAAGRTPRGAENVQGSTRARLERNQAVRQPEILEGTAQEASRRSTRRFGAYPRPRRATAEMPHPAPSPSAPSTVRQ